MKIGFDILGGDFAPEETLEGALEARKELPESDQIVLIGDQSVISDFLQQNNHSGEGFDIVHAPDVIEMGESPTKAFSQKPNSSIAAGFRMLKHHQIDAFTSAGSSGAMLVGSMYSINTVPGIIRPSAITVVPKIEGGLTILIDGGTNPDAKPDVMYQFGIMGSVYAQYVYGIDNPRVGLLNIGTEEKKGNLATQSVFQLMNGTRDFNFIGNVESREFFRDTVDVVVCDGFIGNILLKQAEAMYRVLIKRGIRDAYLDRFNYELYGGSPIVGINATVLVGHGIANALANKNMILLAKTVHQAHLPEKIHNTLSKYDVDTND